MHRLVLRLSPLLASLTLVFGCADDAQTESSSTGTETGTETSSSTGDGDGDPTTTGDGDGDPATGDGDGDPTTTGDGDGDPTGDGDGDPTGDGDGDPTGDGDGDPVEEGASCGTILGCFESCGNDMDCQVACLAAGSMTGQAEANALVQCITDNNCNNDNCIEQNCSGEIFACYTGDLTCAEASECGLMCADDLECQEDCYYSATGLAQAQLVELDECIQANDCGEDLGCIEDNCPGAYAGCIGGGADTLPCPIITECVLDCGGDPACELGCGPATPEAQAEADTLLECAGDNDCQDLECAEQACQDDFFACIAGEGSCADLFACVGGCAGNELCEYNCVVDAALMDQLVAGALYDCVESNNCALDDADCITNNCGGEAIACGI